MKLLAISAIIAFLCAGCSSVADERPEPEGSLEAAIGYTPQRMAALENLSQ